MAATVGAALKKAAVYLLTDKKALKIVGGIVLGIIIIIVMPIAVLLGIFHHLIQADTDRLYEMVEENLAAEKQTDLLLVQQTMGELEEKMSEAGYADRLNEAQILFNLWLSDLAGTDGFADKLASCFAKEQTDEQLIDAVNGMFGKAIEQAEFTKIMTDIRK